MKHLKDIIAILVLVSIVVFIIWTGSKTDEDIESTTEETEKYIVAIDINVPAGLKLTKEEDIKAIIDILRNHDQYEKRRPFDIPPAGLGIAFEYSNGEVDGISVVKGCVIVELDEVYTVGDELVKKLDDYISNTEEYKELMKKYEE